MNVKLMLSKAFAVNCVRLIALHAICAPLSITFRQKRLHKIPAYVVIIFTATTQP